MKIQSGSFAMAGSNYAHMGKEATAINNARMNNKAGKLGNQTSGSTSMSPNSKFDKMIESIQEQIQKVQENDRYDADTKKSKIEELETQLKEIEKARAEQLNESVLGSKKKTENNSATDSSSKTNEKSNTSGVVVDISFDAKALLEADNSLKHLKSANSTKVRLEGESNVLTSEIKIDKGRGVDTTKKEEQLTRLKEGVEKSMENIGETMKDINNAANDASAETKSASETSNEGQVEDSEKPAEKSSDASNNTVAEKTDNGEKTETN